MLVTTIFFHIVFYLVKDSRISAIFVLCNDLNPFPNKPWFLRVYSTSLLKKLGKGEIARNEQFLIFPQCFLPFWRSLCLFHQIKDSFSLDESKICRLGKA